MAATSGVNVTTSSPVVCWSTPSGSVMIAELIYLRIFQSPDWGLGAAISVVLVLFVGALMALLFRYVRPKQLI